MMFAVTVTADVSTLTVNVSFTFLKIRSCARVLSPVYVVKLISFIVSLVKLVFNVRYNYKVTQGLGTRL